MSDSDSKRTKPGGGKKTSKSGSVFSDMEKAGETLLHDLGGYLNVVREKVSKATQSLVDTTSELKDKVTSEENKQKTAELMHDIESTGKRVMENLGAQIHNLRQGAVAAMEAMRAEKAKKRKSQARKVAAKSKPRSTKNAKKSNPSKASTKHQKSSSVKKTTVKKAPARKKSTAANKR